MAQIKKPEVEARILAAARHEFAARGVAGASVAAIAAGAGVATGNVYRYFPSKDALFAAAVPPAVVARLRRSIAARVRALAGVVDVAAVPAGAPYRVLSDELLGFCAAHRLEVVIALAGDPDSPYAAVADQLRRQLVRLAVAHAATLRPPVRITPTTRFVLDTIYRGFVAAMVAILRQYQTADAIAAAVERHAAYHLTGLARLLATEATREAP